MIRDFSTVTNALENLPEVKAARMFGSDGLKVHGKVFCMLVKGRLVVKLAKARAAEMIDAGWAEPFDPGHGRPMKEWVAVSASSAIDWLDLSREALSYVGRLARE